LRDIPYALRVGPVENTYTDHFGGLVLLRGASLPDVCVVCGSPAWGNVYHKEFEPHRYPWWALPLLWDVAYMIFGKRYLLDLPFCSSCQPDDFQIYPARINNDFAVLSGASITFLKLLPSLPQDLAAKIEGNLLQRVLRLFLD
jgi:hypothetical protein